MGRKHSLSLTHEHMFVCLFVCLFMPPRHGEGRYLKERLPYLDFKGEILLEVLDDHNEKRKLDAQCLLGVCRTCYICGTAERRRNIKDKGGRMRTTGAWMNWPELKNPSNRHLTHLTFVPSTSNTSEWMSLSVILLMWPFLTCEHTEILFF